MPLSVMRLDYTGRLGTLLRAIVERPWVETVGPDGGAARALIRSLGLAFQVRGHQLFLVGGAVRDALMGRATNDLDFATDAPPLMTADALASVTPDTLYRIGEKFGTIGATMGVLRVEVTTFRADEQYVSGSRKPSVRFGQTIAEDLSRRDFTINAIARPALESEPLIDPYGGEADVRARVIRTVGDPAARFREDPLRLLRAVRLVGQLSLPGPECAGFRIDPDTWRAMVENARSLCEISRERIADEYGRMLTGEHVGRVLGLLRDSGLLETSVPQLVELTTMPDHGPRHPLSLWDHTMATVERVDRTLTVRWAALLHDIAKPRTRSFDPDGRIRFYDHETVGAQIARDVMLSLRAPRETVEAVALLVGAHMQVHAYSPEWSDGAVRRLVDRLGVHFDAAVQLARADAAAHSPGEPTRNAPRLRDLTERTRRLTESLPTITSPLNGTELMEHYGLPPGRWIRTVKAVLTDRVIDGLLSPSDRAGAWHVADEVVAGLDSSGELGGLNLNVKR